MNWVLLSLFTHCFLTSFVNAQQEYSANSVLDCNNKDETKPSPAFLYACNGRETSCLAFLIFKSQPPYDSVPTISALTSSNPLELARANNVARLTVFPTNKEVIVPVSCLCSGQYYQANTTFLILNDIETYFTVANNTYQGLSTCDSLKRANSQDENTMQRGLRLQVPLRCACPTRNQTAKGTKYLLTYSVSWSDYVHGLGERFNVTAKSILDANGFSEEDPTIFPFTTILIPLPTEPLSSQTIVHTLEPEILPPPTSKDRHIRHRRKLYVGIGSAAGGSLLVIGAILLAIFLFRKKRTEGTPGRNEGKRKPVLPKDLLSEIASFDRVLKVFKFKELEKATGNFSFRSRIKGSVYRGVFSKEILAIKRMSIDVSMEVNMLSKINHFNLIKLHGVCKDRGYFYLVFEYMRNGSLREWLQKKSSNETGGWSQRIQIALDVANGLHYLHNFTKPAYVHKDIKSSNVLLDGSLRAKIANFSLARTTVKGSNNAPQTTRVMGTRGYMAPDYIETGSATPKIDVYAFGVVMLELITGKDAVIIQEGQEVLLSAAIASIVEGENAETELGCFVDPCLGEDDGIEHALQVTRLSLTCLRRDPTSRPSMGEIVSTLLKVYVDIQKSESLC
ncbi:lysM domain receptor-like kinase 4 [Cornus florida]|uniref:lysM domain receptor-like kinase 4 n=1 Tax=Cornus florida TaxID=4283 RepID=UPI0028A2329F|nr:lysM domain receptor-like kinase 4 [Cornus florida]